MEPPHLKPWQRRRLAPSSWQSRHVAAPPRGVMLQDAFKETSRGGSNVSLHALGKICVKGWEWGRMLKCAGECDLMPAVKCRGGRSWHQRKVVAYGTRRKLPIGCDNITCQDHSPWCVHAFVRQAMHGASKSCLSFKKLVFDKSTLPEGFSVGLSVVLILGKRVHCGGRVPARAYAKSRCACSGRAGVHASALGAAACVREALSRAKQVYCSGRWGCGDGAQGQIGGGGVASP